MNKNLTPANVSEEVKGKPKNPQEGPIIGYTTDDGKKRIFDFLTREELEDALKGAKALVGTIGKQLDSLDLAKLENNYKYDISGKLVNMTVSIKRKEVENI